jgi:hypothetical protein
MDNGRQAWINADRVLCAYLCAIACLEGICVLIINELRGYFFRFKSCRSDPHFSNILGKV